MRTFGALVVCLIIGGTVLNPTRVQAGKPTQQQKKPGILTKIGHGIQNIGDKIQNGIMDAGVNIKQKLTGKKDRVWVCGYRNKKGQHVKGHWRTLKKATGGKGDQTGQLGQTGQAGQHPGQGQNPGQGQPGQTPGQGTSGGEMPAPIPPAGELPANEQPGEESPASEPPAAAPGTLEPPPVNVPTDEAPASSQSSPSGQSGKPGKTGHAHQSAHQTGQSGKGHQAGQAGQAHQQAGQSGKSHQTGQVGQAYQQAHQSGQSGQSGQSDQDDAIAPKTLGQYMQSLAEMTDDLDALREQAVQAKAPKGQKSLAPSQQYDEDYAALAEEREAEVKALVQAITTDLDSRKGQAGPLYSAYLRNLKAMDKEDRESLKDVTEQIRSFAKQRASTGGKGNAFSDRVKELARY